MTRNLSTLFAMPIAAVVAAGMLMSQESPQSEMTAATTTAGTSWTAVDPSVPSASTVFAGRLVAVEDMAPTF